ncbi:MAG: SH3 domain-containing protein [Chloroflexi bacterium]|nr:SH3 domain-containing protein [Chloroflexota bacterium]
MRRLAITTQFYCLLLLLAVAKPLTARAYDLPPCTSAEFRTLFDQIAESQIELGRTISSVDGLLDFAQAEIDSRDDQPPEAPPCADAFAYQRLVIELTGDFIGRTALDLAEVPEGDNPYRLHLTGDQERLEGLAAAMLGTDRSDVPEPAKRNTAKCGLGQLTALEDLRAELAALLDGDGDQPLSVIDELLNWREENIRRAPVCTDGIELAMLLSAAATDAAAMTAIDLVAPELGNPYESPLAESEDRLSEWQVNLEERRARYSAETSTVSAALPTCSVTELALAYDKLMPEYTDLLQRGRRIQTAADLQGYNEAYFHYRSRNLAYLPPCAEAFAAAWEVRQLLGDLVSAAARGTVELSGDDSPYKARLEAGSALTAQMIDSMASRLEGAGVVPGETRAETAAACDRGEILVLHLYLVSEFHAFVDAALSAETSADIEKLAERSFDFRDMLWRELPRCAEAIELGLLMRRAAADFIAMLQLEAVGLPIEDIRQAQSLVDDITRLSTRADEIGADAASATQSGKSYYISAGRGANIRACGSTDCDILATLANGQKIDVADDSGAWYKVNLPNNQVGYIAGFLVSKTRPSS